MAQDYFILSVKNLSGLAEDWLSQEAFEFGALGISEVLPFDQPEGEEDVFARIPDRRTVEVYFQTAPAHELTDRLRARFPEVEIAVRGEATRDWLEEWKKGFKPFAITSEHWVVPSWCEAPAQAKHKIWIDPGMAFGTGTHETTQLMAETMSEILAAEKIESCLDVGTGTGILAILARQLGVRTVCGTEIESDSRRVAKENFAKNGFADIALNEQQIEDLSQKFDMVAANIIDGVLVRVQEALKACVKPGGWLVVSGIIGEREKDFREGFKLPQGKEWSKRVEKGDWRLYATRL